MAPTILWYRRDLRVHDLPALEAAVAQAGPDGVLPVFCFDDHLLHGRFPSARRTWFLLQTLEALAARWAQLGGQLWIRRGAPESVLPALAREVGASQVHASEEFSGFGRTRDERVQRALTSAGATLTLHPGIAIATDLWELRTKAGRPHTVFTPFSRSWGAQPRRELLPAPTALTTPPGDAGTMPSLGIENSKRD